MWCNGEGVPCFNCDCFEAILTIIVTITYFMMLRDGDEHRVLCLIVRSERGTNRWLCVEGNFISIQYNIHELYIYCNYSVVMFLLFIYLLFLLFIVEMFWLFVVMFCAIN